MTLHGTFLRLLVDRSYFKSLKLGLWAGPIVPGILYLHGVTEGAHNCVTIPVPRTLKKISILNQFGNRK